MQHDKHFTVDEAREVLDRVEPKVQRILELRHDLDAIGFDMVTGEYIDRGGGLSEEEREEIENKVRRIHELLEEIHETGALFKDPNFEIGTVDFPHINERGEEVYLCWMEGEDDINYWHPIETGMKGRKPIEEL